MITLTNKVRKEVHRRLKNILRDEYDREKVESLLDIRMSDGVYDWVSSYTDDKKNDTLVAIYYSNIYRIMKATDKGEEIAAFERRLHTGGALP